MTDLPEGRKQCDVPGYETGWVQFATRGYPRRLRREWDETRGGEDTWRIVMRYVTAWDVRDLDGQPVPLPEDQAARTLEPLMDNVEDAVVRWVVSAFATYWLRESGQPPKA